MEVSESQEPDDATYEEILRELTFKRQRIERTPYVC